jgi:hypothetical protein
MRHRCVGVYVGGLRLIGIINNQNRGCVKRPLETFMYYILVILCSHIHTVYTVYIFIICIFNQHYYQRKPSAEEGYKNVVTIIL